MRATLTDDFPLIRDTLERQELPVLQHPRCRRAMQGLRSCKHCTGLERQQFDTGIAVEEPDHVLQ